MRGDVRDDERAIFRKHEVEERVFARQFANRLAPVRFDPDAAGIDKANRGRVGAEVLGSQTRNGVVSWLGRSVKNPGGNQRSLPCIFLLPIHSLDLEFCL